jgi:hypothetical protein
MPSANICKSLAKLTIQVAKEVSQQIMGHLASVIFIQEQTSWETQCWE